MGGLGRTLSGGGEFENMSCILAEIRAASAKRAAKSFASPGGESIELLGWEGIDGLALGRGDSRLISEDL